MREIYLNSNVTSKSPEEIKLLTLYYDKINIVNDCFYIIAYDKEKSHTYIKDIQFIPDSFEQEYKTLINEGIISVTKRDETQKKDPFAKVISKVVNSHEEYIFPVHKNNLNSRIITEEVHEILNSLEWYNKETKQFDKQSIWWYYSFKLNWSIKLLLDGHNCINGSENLNFLFKQLIKQLESENKDFNINGYNKSLAVDAIKLKLPNPSVLSFDDVLELKHRLKDELTEFSHHINLIENKNKNIFGSNELTDDEYSAIFYQEIQKPLKDLEIKLKNLKSKTFRTFVSSLKNPKSFVPLIGTVVAGIPIEYAMLTSLGLITGQSYLEYKEEKRNISNNGLYFLLSI